MKVGFVTDTHLGLHNQAGNNEVKNIYKEILEYFEKQNIQTVIHLGDCVDERSDNDLEDLVDFVVGELSQFNNAFVAPGNHDAIGLERSDFQSYNVETPPIELYNSGNHSVLLLETAMEVKYEGLGRISNSSLELVEDRLESGYELTLATHYPLDYNDTGSDVFNLLPEKAFPVNKIGLKGIQDEHSGNITRMFCGHLHPETTTKTEQSQVLESSMVVVEPITSMSLKDDWVKSSINESIKAEDLIFRI